MQANDWRCYLIIALCLAVGGCEPMLESAESGGDDLDTTDPEWDGSDWSAAPSGQGVATDDAPGDDGPLPDDGNDDGDADDGDADSDDDDGGVDESSGLIAFGHVPKPAVVKRHLNGASHPMMGYSTTPIEIEGVVWHRMVGTLWGTDSWFFAGHAATEYGIGVAATDGWMNAGTIIEWIDPANGHWYGHSSGPVSSPYGDGAAFVNAFGVDRVNPQTVAIEISGNYGTPLDAEARQALIELTAYYADQRQIPWDEFPLVPGQNRSFVIWHQEFTIGTGKVCPGTVVIDETAALIDEIKTYMRDYQEQ